MPSESILQNLTDLTPVQAQIVNSLAAGATISAAAARAGISRMTIYNWLHANTTFRSALDIAKAEYAETLRDDLFALSTKALARLHLILDNPDTPPNVLLRAITLILSRPQFPKPGWNLPVPTGTPEENQALQDLAALEADYQQARLSTTIDSTPTESAPAQPQTPRNSSCPCGSGKKFKRCCGHTAPPVLGCRKDAA